MGGVEHILLPEEPRIVVGHLPLVLDLLEWLWLDVAHRDLIRLLQQMLRVVVPLVIILPHALNRGGLGVHLDMVVLEGSSAELTVYLLNMSEGLIIALVEQRDVLHVPVDVSRRHIGMLSSSHKDLDGEMLILVDKLSELVGLEYLAKTFGAAAHIAKVKLEIL